MASEPMFDYVYRLSDRFSLTPFDELSEPHRERFRSYIEDGRYYGLLLPLPNQKLTVKAVNRDLASFLESMKTPQSVRTVLDGYPRISEQDRRQFVIQLVLDCVLEVQENGAFVSGVDAVNRVLLGGEGQPSLMDQSGEETPVQRLSRQALYFGFNCPNKHPRDVSFILYNYNRIPVNRRWAERLPDEKSLMGFLGLERGNTWPGMSNEIKPRPIRYDDDGNENPFDRYWRFWKLSADKDPDASTYKVYISPITESLPEVFRIVRGQVADSEAHAMKIGRTLPSILRPDKLIVFFPRYSAAREFAEHIARQVKAFDSHGTPFSFQVSTDTAAVTMGVDPPRRFGERFSWRLYVVQKAGLAIQAARRADAEDRPGYIRSYLQLMGIDSELWCPADKDWEMDFKLEGNQGVDV